MLHEDYKDPFLGMPSSSSLRELAKQTRANREAMEKAKLAEVQAEALRKTQARQKFLTDNIVPKIWEHIRKSLLTSPEAMALNFNISELGDFKQKPEDAKYVADCLTTRLRNPLLKYKVLTFEDVEPTQGVTNGDNSDHGAFRTIPGYTKITLQVCWEYPHEGNW